MRGVFLVCLGKSQATPVSSVNADRGRQIFNYAKFSTTHVAALNLQKKRRGIASCFEADTIVKDLSVASMRCVLDNI